MKRIALASFFALLVIQTGCANDTGSTSGSGIPACSTRKDCPNADNPCATVMCLDGICRTDLLAEGTAIADSTEGDCKSPICDGEGHITAINDDADILDDGNECTNDICTMGTASHPGVPAGAVCSQNGNTHCNGAGACVECLVVADCPGQDTECQARSCVAGTCGITFVASGMPSVMQTAGDCSQVVCDGAGATKTAPDNTDLPADNNACTADTCTAGVPTNPYLAVDSPCNQDGGKVCNGSGGCVQCNTGNQCSSGVCSNNECQPATCVDSVKNGAETDIDCGGGVCPVCDVGSACQQAIDCSSGVCTGALCSAPVVLGTLPTDGQTAVDVKSAVSIIFSGAMSPATLIAQTTAGPCTGSIQLSTDGFATCLGFAGASPMMSAGDTMASWTPAPALSYGSTYFIRVTTAAHGSDGTPIDATYTSGVGFVTDAPTSTCTGSLVLSQIYGGGGNTGATYKNDFIEIHNRGNSAVNLAGWSVQYASAAGTSWLVTQLNGTIAAGGYYLVQGAGGNIGSALPTPDATGMTNMGASAGKVALVHATAALSGTCPMGAQVVDFVGFGTTANCFEGAAAASPVATANQSMQRINAGCVDTNSNKPDFAIATVLPRNTMSANNICACPIQGAVNESNLAAEIDLCNIQLPTSITVKTQTTTPTMYGRVFEAGFTEAAGVNATVVAEVGFGPANINPTSQSGWQFFPTIYNMQVGNADEYQGSFVAPAPGAYRYTYRASLDSVQWTYCDLNGAGSNAGASFEVTQLPVLTVTP